MSLELTKRAAEAMSVLEPVSDRLQEAVRNAIAAAPVGVGNALDGTWLGAPLHPALTDVPVGAWTAGAVLDVLEVATGSEALRRSADGALAVGVAGAIPAALTGLSDWRYLRGESKRVGSLHAILNSAGLTLNTLSLVLRLTGRRNLARPLSWAGYAIAASAAHVGGELSFGLGVRHNRTVGLRLPSEWTAALDESDLQASALAKATIDGTGILIARSQAGELCALANVCSHLGGPLDEGTREGDSIVCPWHGSRFDLCSGKVERGPAVFPQPRLETRVREGVVEVRQQPD